MAIMIAIMLSVSSRDRGGVWGMTHITEEVFIAIKTEV